jgi:hypothetical protein
MQCVCLRITPRFVRHRCSIWISGTVCIVGRRNSGSSALRHRLKFAFWITSAEHAKCVSRRAERIRFGKGLPFKFAYGLGRNPSLTGDHVRVLSHRNHSRICRASNRESCGPGREEDYGTNSKPSEPRWGNLGQATIVTTLNLVPAPARSLGVRNRLCIRAQAWLRLRSGRCRMDRREQPALWRDSYVGCFLRRATDGGKR